MSVRTQAVLWPDLANGATVVSPPRNGMDRYTGRLLQGWQHVEQSLELIFATPYHTRVLRRWIGSFVPPILGRNITTPTIARFYWAITTAIDLYEPDYRINQIFFMNNVPALSQLSNVSVEASIRAGDASFQQKGTYYPRGHLGDFTPAQPPANIYTPLTSLQLQQLMINVG